MRNLPTDEELAERLRSAVDRLESDGLTGTVLADIERAYVEAEDRAIAERRD